MAGHAVAPTKEPDDSISIQVVPKVDPPPCVWVVARAILLYLLWAFFGFISGAHLFGLMCCPPPSVASRKFVGVQLATHFGALLVFGIGGGTCRSMGADDCPGGEEMSQSCFWYHQNSTYQFFYITHFMALTWLFVQWLSDGLSLWGWSGDGVREAAGMISPMRAFGVHAQADVTACQLRWHYAAVVGCWAFLSLIIWSTKWSTDTPAGGDVTVTGLATICFPVMIIWLVVSCITVRCFVHRQQSDHTVVV